MSGDERFLKKSLFCVTFIASCFFLLNNSFAASIDREDKIIPDSNAKASPPVTTIVSETRREMSVEKSTRFTTVITREEIEKSGKTYVLDLLRAAPGVTVIQSGPAGRTASIFLRGTNANHTLVLLDGVQINSTTTGEANLQHITTQDIERIEILRGPQSVLYGTDALGGVINIVTKAQKKKGLHGGAEFEYGTYETFSESGNLSGNWDRFSFSGSGGRLDTEGPGENDGYENTTARAHVNVRPTENSDLDVAFNHYNSIVGIEDGAFLQDPNASQKSRAQAVNTQYTVALQDWWQQSVSYGFFHDMLFSFDPRNPNTTDTESTFKLLTDRHQIQWQSSFFISDFDVFTLGYDFENSRSNSKGSGRAGFDKIVHDHGWFAQNELTLWDIWTVVGSFRLDHNSFFGTKVIPLVSSALWVEKFQTKIKGSFGRGYKAPTFNQLFFSSPTSPNFGNLNLLPEESWGWDAGVEKFYWNKKASFSAGYFHNDIENLIQSQGSGLTRQAVNVAKARTQGIELEHRINLWKGLDFYTSYTYTDAIDRDSGKRLVRRPWHQGKLGLTYEFRKFRFFSDWTLVGNREETSGALRIKNDGYTLLNLGLSYAVTEFLEFYTRIENATNDQYFEARGFENQSTRFMGGVKAAI